MYELNTEQIQMARAMVGRIATEMQDAAKYPGALAKIIDEYLFKTTGRTHDVMTSIPDLLHHIIDASDPAKEETK